MITFLGFLTANLVGRTIVTYGELLLDRMPLVRNLYRGLKQADNPGRNKSGGKVDAKPHSPSPRADNHGGEHVAFFVKAGHAHDRVIGFMAFLGLGTIFLT